jgi:hypothetical protein
MSNGQPDRERWEAYLMMIFLATRPFLFVGGIIMLVYAVAAISAYPLVGGIALGFAVFLFLIVFYDPVTHFVARVGAYIATFGKR